MAIFDRNYDRGYGYRGGNRGGYDRDLGGRSGGAWESMKRNTREFFGMDNRYDRGYGYDRDMNTTYNNRGTWGAGYAERNRKGSFDSTRGGYGATGGYGRDFRGGTTAGYGTDYAGRGASGGYDRPYWGYDTARYGEDYKSREQTDAGDPFDDRQSGTPIRVVDEPRDRGGWFGGGRDYDRSYRYGRDYNAGRTGYGRDYHAANPMGYDPYDNTRGGQRMGRTQDPGYRRRNYDQDWF